MQVSLLLLTTTFMHQAQVLIFFPAYFSTTIYTKSHIINNFTTFENDIVVLFQFAYTSLHAYTTSCKYLNLQESNKIFSIGYVAKAVVLVLSILTGLGLSKINFKVCLFNVLLSFLLFIKL